MLPGHRVLNSVFDAEDMATLQSFAIEELARRGATDGSLTTSGQPLYVAPGDDVATYLPDLAGSQLLEDVLRKRGVIDEIGDFVGTDELFLHPNRWLRAMPPSGVPGYVPPAVHQDFPELQGSLRQATMWIPVFDVTPETGALPVYAAPGPARVLPLVLDHLNSSGWRVDPLHLGKRTVPSLRAGDGLIFNTLTPHGGSTNNGEGWRVSIEARFQPLAEPICENQLVPFTGVPWTTQRDDWTWHRNTWRSPLPPQCPFDDSWERWRDLTALALGERGCPEAQRALEIAAEFAPSEVTRAHASYLLGRLDQPAEVHVA